MYKVNYPCPARGASNSTTGSIWKSTLARWTLDVL